MESARGERREWITRAGVLLLAAALRFLYVWSVSASPHVRYPMVDRRAYHEWALQILSGDWIGEQIFYQDPLYPYFLALLYAAFGAGSLGVLFAQALLDAFTALLIYLIARRVFDYRCAVVAGLLAAFYKVFFYYDALLLKAPLALFLFSLTLFLLVRADSDDWKPAWLGAGVALGLAALTRGNYLVLVPVVLVWIFVTRRSAPMTGMWAAGMLVLGLCLSTAPVALRNYLVGGDLVLITSQMGQNFYIGNHRGNSTGCYKAPPFLRASPLYEEEDFRNEAVERNGRAMKPSEVSRYWFRETLKEIEADPGHFARHTLLKARIFFNDFEVADNQSYNFFRERVTPLLRLPMPTYGALLPLSLCGMVFVRRNRKAALLTWCFLSYSASVILFYNMSRYRIPVVAIVIVFAASGVWALIDLVRERNLRRALLAACLLALAYPIAFQDVADDNYSLAYFNLGRRYLDQAVTHRSRAEALALSGDDVGARREADTAEALLDRAEQEFQRGLDENPANPILRRQTRELLSARVLELMRAGRYESALARAHDLTWRFPRFVDGHALLGAAYSRLGRYQEARRALRTALTLAPGQRRASAELELVDRLEAERAGGGDPSDRR